ncbi:unnamed protein product, partial [Eretmochelys imbricata]
MFHVESHLHSWVYFIPFPPIICFLCVCLSCLCDMTFPALCSVCAFSFPFPSQRLQTDHINPDDIDLENEPWYKFFSELEFGCPPPKKLLDYVQDNSPGVSNE